MSESTERALRWFLRTWLEREIFRIETVNNDINLPMGSPPDKLCNLRVLLKRIVEEDELDKN